MAGRLQGPKLMYQPLQIKNTWSTLTFSGFNCSILDKLPHLQDNWIFIVVHDFSFVMYIIELKLIMVCLLVFPSL